MALPLAKIGFSCRQRLGLLKSTPHLGRITVLISKFPLPYTVTRRALKMAPQTANQRYWDGDRKQVVLKRYSSLPMWFQSAAQIGTARSNPWND